MVHLWLQLSALNLERFFLKEVNSNFTKSELFEYTNSQSVWQLSELGQCIGEETILNAVSGLFPSYDLTQRGSNDTKSFFVLLLLLILKYFLFKQPADLILCSHHLIFIIVSFLLPRDGIFWCYRTGDYGLAGWLWTMIKHAVREGTQRKLVCGYFIMIYS